MAFDKKIANKVLMSLDDAAGKLDSLAKAGKIDPKVASVLVNEIDTFADKFETAAFGPNNLANRKAKLAKVIQKDKDEAYMDTFENTVKPLQTDSDEEYMHKMGPSFNGKGQDTFDNDLSSSVTNRDEYAVRDLSEWTESTKKQPSWSKGPAGKSTKQGSAPRTAGKNWAP
jgi:hypothetical protein